MADRHTRIFGSQIKDLTITTDDIAANAVTEAKIDINTAAGVGVDGYVLYWNNGAGKLDYKAVVAQDLTSVVLEADVIANEVPTGDINDINVTFILANTPESGTVVVLLNGIQQQPGSGNDYVLSGTSVIFSTAPETGMDIMVNYIKQS